MIGFVAVLATGYVLGTKAGRERYEQIAGTARAVAGHPAATSAMNAGYFLFFLPPCHVVKFTVI